MQLCQHVKDFNLQDFVQMFLIEEVTDYALASGIANTLNAQRMYNNTVSPRQNICGMHESLPQIKRVRTKRDPQEEQVINLIIFLKLIHFYIKNLK